MSPSIIRDLAKNYMLELGKQIPINTSLRDWFSSFMNRWSSELTVMKTMKLEKIRSKGCTKAVVGKNERSGMFNIEFVVLEKWFERLHSVMTKLNLFNRPNAIWNVDESGFGDDPGRRQVVVKRSSKYAISSHSGSGKNYNTILMCTSATGE